MTGFDRPPGVFEVVARRASRSDAFVKNDTPLEVEPDCLIQVAAMLLDFIHGSNAGYEIEDSVSDNCGVNAWE